MADIANIVEAVGATIAAGAIIWKPVMGKRDKNRSEKIADDVFLHGSPAISGVRVELPTAAIRLTGVETGLHDANNKLDALSLDVKSLSLDVRSVAGQVRGVAHEVHTNQGGSMKDNTEAIIAEQGRVAEEHLAERGNP